MKTIKLIMFGIALSVMLVCPTFGQDQLPNTEFSQIDFEQGIIQQLMLGIDGFYYFFESK